MDSTLDNDLSGDFSSNPSPESGNMDIVSLFKEDPMVVAGIALCAGYLIGSGRSNLVTRTAGHMFGSMGRFAFGYALESFKDRNRGSAAA